MMTVWNVYLSRQELPIRVRKVLKKEPEFMVIVDSQGKQHELSEVDFSSLDWENIKTGSIITLILKQSVMTWRVRPPRVERSIKKLIVEVQRKASGYFFIWICEHCGINGYVEYEEGDDSQGIAERVILAHKQEVKPGCKQDIRIFDNRGIEQPDSALLVSSRRVE